MTTNKTNVHKNNNECSIICFEKDKGYGQMVRFDLVQPLALIA